MAGSVNKVILIGNLGADPEIKSLNNGDKIANMSIATSESWKDKTSGEKKERTQWHRVVIWNQHLIKIAEQYLHKGDSIYLEGQIENRSWEDKDGQKKYATEVVLRFNGVLTMLKTKRNDEGGGAKPAQSTEQKTGHSNDMDDEIPF